MTHVEIKNLLFEKLYEIIPKDKREGIGIIIGTFDEYGYTTDDRVMNSVNNNLIIANTTMLNSKVMTNVILLSLFSKIISKRLKNKWINKLLLMKLI